MSLPPSFRPDLWRRLAQAQDAGGPNPRRLREMGLAVAARLARMPRTRVRRRAPALSVALGALTVAVAVAVVVGHSVSRRPVVGSTALSLSGPPRSAEQAFVADARSDLPLQFADGSVVIFRAGSAGRMRRLADVGAEIVLERGALEAHVVHTPNALWLVHAGPYRVRVTGTRFAMAWAAAAFEVDLYEGAVVVDGAALGAGLPLRAGNRLKVASGTVLIEPLTSGGAVAPRAASGVSESAALAAPVNFQGGTRAASASIGRSAAGRFPSGRSSDDQWLTLADRGAYPQALAAAERLGWSALCHHLDARRLLTLGDVARYAGAQVRAKQAFEMLVTRFPGDHLAADAVFSLGRLAFESRHPDEATHWFRRYVADWPHAPLADQAAGRLLECAIRVDDHAAAGRAARQYLARAPHGPHATLAHEVLDQPVDGPP